MLDRYGPSSTGGGGLSVAGLTYSQAGTNQTHRSEAPTADRDDASSHAADSQADVSVKVAENTKQIVGDT